VEREVVMEVSKGPSVLTTYKLLEPGFEKKEIKFIIHQMKRRTGRVNLSKHCWTSERKCPPFKGEFRAQLDCVARCVFTMAAGLDSSGVQGHISEVLCLG
jgi:hypothetical protein